MQMKLIQLLKINLCRLFSVIRNQKIVETEASIYVFFFKHNDLAKYINKTRPGTIDSKKCLPVALMEDKTPYRIFLNLECIEKNLQRTIKGWKDMSDENKDEFIINFIEMNINHEHHHKAIFKVLDDDSYSTKPTDEAFEKIVVMMDFLIAHPTFPLNSIPPDIFNFLSK